MITAGGWNPFNDEPTFDCDLFIHAVGFENRSVEILRRNSIDAKKVLSIDFQTPGIFSYDQNLLLCRAKNTSIISTSTDIRSLIQQHIVASKKHDLSIVLDISSLNRRILADILWQLARLKESIGSLKLIYTPQKYAEPEPGFSSKVGGLQSIIPELTAFDSDPDRPIALLLGLGYEYGLGLGLLDLIEPETTICFRATGFDPRYDDAVKRANFDFEFSTADLLVQSYTLLDPVAAYSNINNLTYGLLSSHRIEIVPLGPKLFAAYAILLSLTFFGHVTVLRIPSNVRQPRNAIAGDGFLFAQVQLSQLPNVDSVYSSASPISDIVPRPASYRRNGS